MTLPALDTLCKAIEEFPLDLCVTLPGGANVCAQLESLPPSLLQMAKGALGQANSALAPLTPIFDIIETLVAIQNCVKAIPDALGPPPDPAKLGECLPELAKRIEKLISLLPPASILLMLVQLLDVIIAVLNGTISELRAILRLLERIARARALSGAVPSLLSAIDCGERTAAVQMSNIERAIAAINPILDLINGFGNLAGIEPIPHFEGLPEGPAAAIAALQGLVDGLQALRDTIPV
jgi:hypothetical protein